MDCWISTYPNKKDHYAVHCDNVSNKRSKEQESRQEEGQASAEGQKGGAEERHDRQPKEEPPQESRWGNLVFAFWWWDNWVESDKCRLEENHVRGWCQKGGAEERNDRQPMEEPP